MPEHRKAQRRRVLKTAKIIFNGKSSVIDCTVRNLSADGALLIVPSTMGIPADFELVLDGESRPIFCRKVWQRERQLGVLFSGGAVSA